MYTSDRRFVGLLSYYGVMSSRCQFLRKLIGRHLEQWKSIPHNTPTCWLGRKA